MSLQQLGFASLPVYRQLTGTGSGDELPSQDLAQDSKDVLLDRLSDLVTLLSEGGNLDEVAMTEIHSRVDQIEDVIQRREKSPKLPRGLKNIHEPTSPRSVEDVFWGPPTPTRSMSMRLSNAPAQQERYISPFKAIQIANEAENIAAKYGFYSLHSVYRCFVKINNPQFS